MQPSDDEIRAMLAGATPGPWRIAGEKTIRTDSRWIAKANWDNGKANAPLLAAAPDLAALALSRGDAQAKAEAENARLRDAASFLLDRLHEYDLTDDADEMCDQFMGHVEPAMARLSAALGGDDA